jgi:hypothetical protein
MSYVKHRKGRKGRKVKQYKLFANFAFFAVSAHGLPDMLPKINFKLIQSPNLTINISTTKAKT